MLASHYKNTSLSLSSLSLSYSFFFLFLFGNRAYPVSFFSFPSTATAATPVLPPVFSLKSEPLSPPLIDPTRDQPAMDLILRGEEEERLRDGWGGMHGIGWIDGAGRGIALKKM